MDTADTEVDTASLSEDTPRSTLKRTDLVDMDMVDTAVDTVDTAVDTVDTAVDTVDTAVDKADTAVDIPTDTALMLEMDMAAMDINVCEITDWTVSALPGWCECHEHIQ